MNRVIVDYASWMQKYPSGCIEAYAKREGDTACYQIELEDNGHGQAVWNVGLVDTIKVGRGEVEFQYKSNGTLLAKSEVFPTVVDEADMDRRPRYLAASKKRGE